MFDYDTRPATPQVVLVGSHASTEAYAIRDFLTRNAYPYDWVDADNAVRAATLVAAEDLDPEHLPLCILSDGTRIPRATVEQVATGLGMISGPARSEYDLLIVGAGPAGLGAAVNAASEGLSTLVVEGVAPGGQAGTTSLIENYLGFPTGISGSELATRATAQARRFGAEILLARRLTRVAPDRPGHVAELSDGTTVRSRAGLVATGVEWRRLDVPGVDAMLGAGVYYGAGPSEALACSGSGVVLVGGGNSAGQAALRFARYARKVTLLVRASSIGHSMSQYLVDHIEATPAIEVRTGAQVAGIDADGRLRAVLVSTGGGELERLDADALFICIGGVPRTGAFAGAGGARDSAGYILTGGDLAATPEAMAGWPLERRPLPLETSMPGIFAAGDVRHGSTKRCAAAIGEGGMAVAMVHQRLAEIDGG